MQKKLLSTVIVMTVTALLLAGCGSSSSGSSAEKKVVTSSGPSTATDSSAPVASKDDAFINDPQFQSQQFDFKDYIKNDGETDGALGSVVGTKIHYLHLDELGMGNDIDFTSTIGAGEITEEFVLASDKGEIAVRAINVFGFPVELDQCFICSVKITDKSGVYSLEKDMTCGIRTYDEILNYYSDHNLYLKEANVLTYKESNKDISYGTNTSPEGDQANAIFANTREVDGIFKFDNGVLTSISLEAPELLYYELRRNVNQYELEQMSDSELSEIEKKRNEFLGELKSAFAASAVDVAIDDTTGNISMNSDILFDTDSYEVKAAAKEYIDEFFKVYTSVIMRDDVQSSIQSVRFEGHTDTQGDYDYNMTLSLNRAKSVMDYCVNESSLDDSIKSVLGSLAEAKGYSYQYPIYSSDGQVDMDASRRVEVNFVIKTDFAADEPAETAASSDTSPSATARGVEVNPNFKKIDTADYTDIVEQHLSVTSPVLLVGDLATLYPGNYPDGYDRARETYTVESTNVGTVLSEQDGSYTYYYFRADAPGKTKITAISPTAAHDGTDREMYVTVRTYSENGAAELKLTPDRDTVVAKDQYTPESVKFTLSGDYSGEVWAFAYCDDPDASSVIYKADWIDPTTLSIDILQGILEEGDHYISIILTPKDDLDTMLGCLKYKFTVEKN